MKNQFEAKQYQRIAVIFGAVFAIYNIIVMLLFSGKNNIFWISYVFMCLAFGAVVVSMLTAFKRSRLDGTLGEAIFWGIPLFSFSIFYYFGELFLSFVFMLFRNHADPKLCIAIQLIFLLVFVIFAMLALVSRDVTNQTASNVASNVREMKFMSADVAALERDCQDPELKKQLHKVEEAIRFSDPMKNSSVAGLDLAIANLISSLEQYCRAAQEDPEAKQGAMQTCQELLSQIAKRNDRLRISK